MFKTIKKIKIVDFEYNYTVTSYGTTDAENFLFPEERNFQPSLRESYIDATDFEKKVSTLHDNERRAIRSWTAVDQGETRERYSDNSRGVGAIFNYKLNEDLYNGRKLIDSDRDVLNNILSGLSRLPNFHGESIRVAFTEQELSLQPYGFKIFFNDIVTNYPCLMSSCQSYNYIHDTIILMDGEEDYKNKKGIFIYKIDTTTYSTCVPLYYNTLSLSKNEQELLFKNNSYFRVKSFSIAKPNNEYNFKSNQIYRVAIILEQISPVVYLNQYSFDQVYMKNIFTGDTITFNKNSVF